VIAGDGPFRSEYEQKAHRLGIARNVSFIGLIQDPLGEGLYESCDIACQVSRWEEAFGLTIAEAMACGRPVVGTRVGGIPEIIADGVSGYLVDRGDVAAIAENIICLAKDPMRRASFGQAGRDICIMNFDLMKNVASLVRFYLSCFDDSISSEYEKS
jgi:L-malate glycosyltransferase